MKEIYTKIEINAPASVVWSILNDFDKFPTWNPFMKKISGNLHEGSDLEAFIQPPFQWNENQTKNSGIPCRKRIKMVREIMDS